MAEAVQEPPAAPAEEASAETPADDVLAEDAAEEQMAEAEQEPPAVPAEEASAETPAEDVLAEAAAEEQMADAVQEPPVAPAEDAVAEIPAEDVPADTVQDTQVGEEKEANVSESPEDALNINEDNSEVGIPSEEQAVSDSEQIPGEIKAEEQAQTKAAELITDSMSAMMSGSSEESSVASDGNATIRDEMSSMLSSEDGTADNSPTEDQLAKDLEANLAMMAAAGISEEEAAAAIAEMEQAESSPEIQAEETETADSSEVQSSDTDKHEEIAAEPVEEPAVEEESVPDNSENAVLEEAPQEEISESVPEEADKTDVSLAENTDESTEAQQAEPKPMAAPDPEEISEAVRKGKNVDELLNDDLDLESLLFREQEEPEGQNEDAQAETATESQDETAETEPEPLENTETELSEDTANEAAATDSEPETETLDSLNAGEEAQDGALENANGLEAKNSGVEIESDLDNTDAGQDIAAADIDQSEAEPSIGNADEDALSEASGNTEETAESVAEAEPVAEAESASDNQSSEDLPAANSRSDAVTLEEYPNTIISWKVPDDQDEIEIAGGVAENIAGKENRAEPAELNDSDSENNEQSEKSIMSMMQGSASEDTGSAISEDIPADMDDALANMMGPASDEMLDSVSEIAQQARPKLKKTVSRIEPEPVDSLNYEETDPEALYDAEIAPEPGIASVSAQDMDGADSEARQRQYLIDEINLARLYFETGDTDEALKLLKDVTDKGDDSLIEEASKLLTEYGY